MGTVLTLAVSAYFFIISYRLKFAFFLFVFLIPFLPKYIGLGVGGEGFALSLKRILLMILFVFLSLSFMQNSKYILKRVSLVYQQNKILVNLFILYFLIKILSLTLNSREVALYIMLFDDFLFSAFVFLLTIIIIDSNRSLDYLIKMIFYGYSIVLLFALLEFFLRFPLLSIFASGQMELSRDVSRGIMRGDMYRVSGTLSGPIALGQYLVVLFPIISAYINQNRYTLVFKVFYYLFIGFAIYSTGSRAAILMFGGIIYFHFILKLYTGTQLSRFFGYFINLVFFLIALYFMITYISSSLEGFTGRFDLITDPEKRSTVSRALQYSTMYDVMQEAPFFGFGRERNYLKIIEDLITIDNAFFWKILEVGLVGIMAYLLFLYTVVKTGMHLYINRYNNKYLLPLLISVLISILYHILTTELSNHIYIYIFTGIFSVMKTSYADMEYKRKIEDKRKN